jgi:hypothetical protein
MEQRKADGATHIATRLLAEPRRRLADQAERHARTEPVASLNGQ